MTLVKKKKKLLLPLLLLSLSRCHAGNGIQDITLHREDILYISLHRGNGFYPGTGSPHEVGDPGKNPRSMGSNANVAWPRGGLGDAEYDAAFDLVLLPLARAFDPDLVLVAAGFDAAAGDPLGGMSVSPRGYAHMTRRLLTLARGRAVLALEGGYNVGATAAAAAACVEVLLADKADSSSSPGSGAGAAARGGWGAAVPSASSASATTTAVGGKATRSGSSEEDETTTTGNASVAVETEEKSSGDDEDDGGGGGGESGSESESQEEEEDGFVLGRAVARPSRDAAPALAATAAALAPHWPQSAELARVGTPAGFSAAWRDYCLKAKPARLTRSSRRKSL